MRLNTINKLGHSAPDTNGAVNTTDTFDKLQQSINKYTTAKSVINKDIGTDERDKTGVIDKSGNQDTPVKSGQQSLLGTNQSGKRDKPQPPNLNRSQSPNLNHGYHI